MTRWISRSARWALFACGLVIVSCGGDTSHPDNKSDSEEECSVGAEGCACTSGGGCDEGLSCLSDICIDSGTGDGDGDGDEGCDCGDGETCLDGACIPGPCEPGQTQCAGNGVQACTASGQWGEAEVCAWPTPACAAGECIAPPSCDGLAPDCGPSSNESCCTSPEVTGGTFYRGNNSVDDTSEDYPATVADFRLDKYEVTVGRFRKFVDAVVGGWRPSAGSGKHTHLNDGDGLANSGSGGGSEPGWDTDWNGDDEIYRMHAAQEDWDASLTCDDTVVSWTASSGANETRPISCVNWYQAAAFCIWDGGFLPSEAEWNYAAAGGDEQRYYPWSSPADSTHIDCDNASYHNCVVASGSLNSLIEVGTKPDGNGLFGQADLSGNVWEWTLDGFANPYQTPCDNCADMTPASRRVLRGGGYSNDASFLRSSGRRSYDPDHRFILFGLRCARSP